MQQLVLIPYTWHIDNLDFLSLQRKQGAAQSNNMLGTITEEHTRGVDSHGEDWKLCTREGCTNYRPRTCLYCSERCTLQDGGANSPLVLRFRDESLKFTERAFRILRDIGSSHEGFKIPLGIDRSSKKSLSRYIPKIDVISGFPAANSRLAVEFYPNYSVYYSQLEEIEWEEKARSLVSLGWRVLSINPADLRKETKTAYRQKLEIAFSLLLQRDGAVSYLNALPNIFPQNIACIGKLYSPVSVSDSNVADEEVGTLPCAHWVFLVESDIPLERRIESVFESQR